MPVKMTIRSFEKESSIGRLRIGIAGLGLMGGSLAMALRGRVSSIVGYEKRILTRQIALREGIVDEVAEELLPREPDVDLLVLATPVRNILDTLGLLPQLWPAGCPVIDLGSTKQAIVRAMDALPDGFTAIGGHPMCGRETAGLASAAADLYRDQLFVLCPSHRTTRELESTALALIESVGGHAIRLGGDRSNLVEGVAREVRGRPRPRPPVLLGRHVDAGRGEGELGSVVGSAVRGPCVAATGAGRSEQSDVAGASAVA